LWTVRKNVIFIDTTVSGFSVLGDLLSVVRIKRDMRPALNETDLMARLNAVDEQSALAALMEHTVDRFIGSHILRVTLPAGITAALKGSARSTSGDTLDINLSRAIGEGKRIETRLARTRSVRPKPSRNITRIRRLRA